MNKIKKFYSTKRVQKAVISILAIMIIMGGMVFTAFYKPNSPSKANVSITLISDDIKEKAVDVNVNILINADVEILKDDGKLVEDVSMSVNKPSKLKTTLEAGTYKIHMTSSPIEHDGSTYKIPHKIDNIVISDNDATNGKTIEVNVKLERIAVADMSKEQLEIVIERITKESSVDNKELIANLKKRQETAVSDATSGEDMKQDSQVEDAPKSDDTPKSESKPDKPKPEDKPNNSGSSGSSGNTSGSSGGSGSGSGSSGNTPSKHEHSWTPVIVNHPAIPAQGYNETIPAVTKQVPYIIYDDGCKFEKKNSNDETRAMMVKHDKDHGMQGYRGAMEIVIITPESSRWVETAPAQPAWSETTGYTCACGASK